MNESDSANIPLRFSHGTAKQIEVKSILPETKTEKELFWVKAAIEKSQILPDVKDYQSNQDDSNGNHDVIIVLADDTKIGVQVTELTFELERFRQGLRKSYLKKILKEIKSRGLTSEKKVVFQLIFPYTEMRKPQIEKDCFIVNEIDEILKSDIKEGIHNLKNYKIIVSVINEEIIYLPHVGNIGINVDFDLIPRSLNFYKNTVDVLFEKKSDALSSFLLIWSLEIWRDFHYYGESILSYLKEKFNKSKFDHVLFAESLNGDGLFQANLHIHIIK